MLDWVHCNNCYTRYRPGIQFYLTTCGHISCQVCVKKISTNGKCLVCSNTCEITLLSNNLSVDLQWFFRPQLDILDRSKQVCTFQLNNAMALLKNVTSKYTMAKAELLRYYKQNGELKKEMSKLRLMLKNATGGYATSTPMMQGGMPMAASGNIFPTMGGTSLTPISNISEFSSRQADSPVMNHWTQLHRRGYPKNAEGRYNEMETLSDNSSFAAQEPSPAMNMLRTPMIGNHRNPLVKNQAMMSMSRLNLGLKKPN